MGEATSEYNITFLSPADTGFCFGTIFFDVTSISLWPHSDSSRLTNQEAAKKARYKELVRSNGNPQFRIPSHTYLCSSAYIYIYLLSLFDLHQLCSVNVNATGSSET